jgi:hypothetical protein
MGENGSNFLFEGISVYPLIKISKIKNNHKSAFYLGTGSKRTDHSTWIIQYTPQQPSYYKR